MPDQTPLYKIVLTAVLAVLFVTGIGFTLFRMPRQEGPVQIVQPTAAAPREIKVYVSGAVAKPGVYPLDDGQRVEEALARAGGALPQADLSRLNLAVRVRDEMQINVPAQGEPAASMPAGDSRIDINSAPAAMLDTLPGIGEVTVQKIIDYRQKNGSFKQIEELTTAKLVNAATFEKIKDMIVAR